MDTTNTAETAEVPGLRETLSDVAGTDLGTDTFHRLALASYTGGRGRDDLAGLLAEWDSLSGEFSGKGPSEVVAGYLLMISGEVEEAVERLKAQKRVDWGCYWLARALAAARRPAEALRVARDAHEKHPEFEQLSFLTVELLCRQGEEEAGRELLDSMAGAAGESALWAYHDGFCHERTGAYREAIAAYRLATERDPDLAEAWFRLAFLVDLYGNEDEESTDEAVKAYEICVHLAPVHTRALVNLGLIYEDRERYHDAVKCYEAVLRANPNHERARLYLGDAIAATKMFYDRDQEKKADRHSQVLKIPVTDFELSVRSRNCLHKMNIETLGDLIMKTEQELLSYKNFGETSLKEIRDMLGQKGLRLGQGLEERGREPPQARNPLEATAPSDVLEKPIEELSLSVRSRRCMERLDVRSVRDLINKTEVELMSAKNFGMTSLNEIKRKLAELGLALRS